MFKSLRKITCLLSFILVNICYIGNTWALDFNSKPDIRNRPQQVVSENELVFTRSNVITIRGAIDDSTVSRIIKEFGENKSDSPILFIHSGGGSVMAGLQLVQYIQDSPRKIRCYASFAASMAFVVFQACHERLVGSTSTLMQHQSSGGTEGKLEEAKSSLENWKNMITEMEEAQAKRLQISVEDFRKKIDNDWFLFGKEIVKNHAADKVVMAQCESDIASETQSIDQQIFIFNVNMTFSKCPLSVGPLSMYISTVSGSSRYDVGPSQSQYESLIKYLEKGLGKSNLLPQPNSPIR